MVQSGGVVADDGLQLVETRRGAAPAVQEDDVPAIAAVKLFAVAVDRPVPAPSVAKFERLRTGKVCWE